MNDAGIYEYESRVSSQKSLARKRPTHAPSNGQPKTPEAHLNVILETAEYISDRAAHLQINAAEGLRAGETLSAVARQIRTLSSNTSLEASRLEGSATVAEIARQMRLLSQQVTALSEHLSTFLRSQNVALGELSGAVDALLVDTASAQVALRSTPTQEDITLPIPLLAENLSVQEGSTNG